MISWFIIIYAVIKFVFICCVLLLLSFINIFDLLILVFLLYVFNYALCDPPSASHAPATCSLIPLTNWLATLIKNYV